MKSIEYIHTLAIQYFNGTISSEGEKELFHLLENNTEAKNSFRKWEDQWMANGMNNPISEMSWKRMQSKIETSQALQQTRTASKKTYFIRNWFRVASCIAVLLLCVTGYLWVRDRQIISSSNKNYFTCSAPNGGKSRIELPDGTVVSLNAGSSLRYSQNFGIVERTVTLDGEGYFEVSQKDGQNFQVYTNGYKIIVKGTKFNVSAYESEQFVTTTLLEGIVEVTKDKTKYYLHPGEELTLDKKSGKFMMQHTNAEQSILWSKNQLDYSDITLKELISKLSRQYNVYITINKTAEQYADRKIRISLKNHETIDEVISALQKILPVSITRKNQNIEIK